MSLTYVTITGTWEDGSGEPLNGTATFTPSASVYASGVPVLQADTPVLAAITGGQLLSSSGGPLRLLPTDSPVTVEGLTGFWFWTVQITVAGVDQDPWSFFLPSTPATVDLGALVGTPAG
jgi:hypothetical protein